MILATADQQLAIASTKTLNDARSPFAIYKPGRKGTATVLTKGPVAHGRLLVRFAMTPSKKDREGAKAEAAAVSMASIKPGDVLEATIKSREARQLNLDFGGRVFGRVLVSEITDEPDFQSKLPPTSSFTKGQTVRVKVTTTNTSNKQNKTKLFYWEVLLTLFSG